MHPNKCPGKLLVLEGLDGAGTTTQSARLIRWLRDEKHICPWATREPSQGPIGVQIRSVLKGRLSMDAHTLAALFAADRLDHLYGADGVVEHLQRGEWVIMDRYYLSSFAYQALNLKGADEQRWLWDIHAPCIMPDMTFFLDVPVSVCIERISSNRGNHFEIFEKQDILERVSGQYNNAIDYLRQCGENIQRIDGCQSVEQVTQQVQEGIAL